MSLTLDVSEIARTRQTVEGTLELDEMPELAHFIQALEGSLKFSVTGLGIVERLPPQVSRSRARSSCSARAATSPSSVPVSRELVFRFTKTEAEADALPLDEEGDDEEVIVGSRSLSVADWVQEEAILSLPAMPLHDDCEMDYENTSDEVVEAEKPNPFAALAALKHWSPNTTPCEDARPAFDSERVFPCLFGLRLSGVGRGCKRGHEHGMHRPAEISSRPRRRFWSCKKSPGSHKPGDGCV